jgi:sulfur transfer complex TusBCD TusB component (DsrH family)
MKVSILLKSGPNTAEAERTLTTASDMLSQGHSVTLCLLQDAVHFCRPEVRFPAADRLQALMERQLAVHVLKADYSLRGLAAVPGNNAIIAGDYSFLIDLIESSDRVIGIL